MRLDLCIAEKYSMSRNKARQLIEAGLVSVNEQSVVKPSFTIIGDEEIGLQEDKRIEWVSRSAGKLDGFLDQIAGKNKSISILGAFCLDVGSSTGGFTQVLLERGAVHVDAVDVGTDQLHEKIRTDSGVMSYEQTDIRSFMNRESGIENREVSSKHDLRISIYDIIVCDTSFISLREILPSVLRGADRHTHIILLWKPQFEVGREHLRKTGVPRDVKIVAEKQKLWEHLLQENNCEIIQKEQSSVLGEAGNQEWLYSIQKVG